MTNVDELRLFILENANILYPMDEALPVGQTLAAARAAHAASKTKQIVSAAGAGARKIGKIPSLRDVQSTASKIGKIHF